jgi:PhnB protein
LFLFTNGTYIDYIKLYINKCFLNLNFIEMKTINPYLNFPGTAEEAFNFYKSVFGGEFLSVMRFKDTEEADKISDSEKEKLMHISLPIGKGTLLMGSDVPESMGMTVTYGNNYFLSIDAESREEADKIFNALSENGKIEMPMQDMFWGAYFGMCADKFGIQWMVSFENNVK